MQKFTHLHAHSHYSLLDGLPKIDQMLDYAKELGMDSLAVTDHGNIYGAIEFYKKAKERGIKAIIGAEMYQAFEKYTQERPNIDDKRYHLILLVKNKVGYKNLVKLITRSYLEGFYYKPRVDEELLKEYSEGLIALSACLQGKIPKLTLANKISEAEKQALKYQEIFGQGNFYLELQHHQNIPDQKKVNAALISISKKTGVPLVATADFHYLKKEDSEAQDILMLINTGADLKDPERLTMKQDDFSMKSALEMAEFFKDTPQAIENTQKIAEDCNFEFELGKIKLPQFETPSGKTANEHLTELCQEGLKIRYGEKPEKEVLERLNYELAAIKQTGLASYFLIVQDFVNWAKQQRIVVGPGRGSAAGSLVSYVLNITNVDPLKYNLLFERFLNPGRAAELPDIDLDFTDRRRDEVINYVTQKYGKDRVAQIITFGTMASRAVVRDVGRALNYQYSYCDRIAKMIPFGLTLDQTLAQVSEFRQIYLENPEAARLIDFAKKLEGCARHASTHACGVVISEEPLDTIVPLQHPTQNDSAIVTQFEMHSIADLGLLKMDFLGLKNLTIIEDTLARIYKVQGKSIDIQNVPLADSATFKLLQKGETISVFQLESDGMRRYLKELKPTELEDIIAMVTLYRPGPMQFIPDYIAGKHKKKKIEYLHPKLKPILEKTYGVCIFQEQLMEIAKELAGFTLSEADVLRKAVGKKIKKLLAVQEEKLTQGMVNNGISEGTAKKIWHWVLPFARYGFNRCLTGDTKIYDQTKGKLVNIKDIYDNKVKNFNVASLSETTIKLTTKPATKVFLNGKKKVWQLITNSGRKIKATANHPFLTSAGWKVLKNLKVGGKIAVPRRIPEPISFLTVEKHKLGLLGYLLAEGNFCHPYGFYFYSKSEEEIKDYLSYLEKFENTIGKIDRNKSAVAVYSKRKNVRLPSEAVEWINFLGLRYKKATEKFFPDFVFNLSNDNLAFLIAKMFQGDGCINDKRKGAQIFYASSSQEIACGLQHLLLRFGILSTVHQKQFKYRHQIKIGYTITVSRYDSIKKFVDAFSSYFVGQKMETAVAIIKRHPIINGALEPWAARGSFDVIPVELVREKMRDAVAVSGSGFKEFERQYDLSWRLFMNDKRKIGYLRETIGRIADITRNNELSKYAESDIYWDEIKNIEYAGTENTYDLTVPDTHNFVANDIIVHNSHAAAYALIAYQTAYLKANFPVEFMASVLTSEKADVERIGFLIAECKKMGIDVLPPDVNESLQNFTVVPPKQIRFGLLAVKNVGHNVVEAVVNERKTSGPYRSIFDFVSRLNSKDLNKKSMESLIKAGAFDKLGERNQLLLNLERLLEVARENQKVKENGQKGLFDGIKLNSNFNLSAAAPASKTEKLSWEKELLGLFVTSHPLEDFRSVFEKKALAIAKISSFINQRVKIGGIISGIKKIITKTGRPMLFVKLEDLTDKIEMIAFPGVIEKNPLALQENKIVLVSGRIDNRDGTPKIIAEEVEEILEET